MFSCCPRLSNWVASLAVCGVVFGVGSWFGANWQPHRANGEIDWSSVVPAQLDDGLGGPRQVHVDRHRQDR